jgi:hypothetical protein
MVDLTAEDTASVVLEAEEHLTFVQIVRLCTIALSSRVVVEELIRVRVCVLIQGEDMEDNTVLMDQMEPAIVMEGMAAVAGHNFKEESPVLQVQEAVEHHPLLVDLDTEVMVRVIVPVEAEEVIMEVMYPLYHLSFSIFCLITIYMFFFSSSSSSSSLVLCIQVAAVELVQVPAADLLT